MCKLAIAMKNLQQIISEKYSGPCVKYFFSLSAFACFLNCFHPLAHADSFMISSENDPTTFQGRGKGISLGGVTSKCSFKLNSGRRRYFSE